MRVVFEASGHVSKIEARAASPGFFLHGRTSFCYKEWSIVKPFRTNTLVSMTAVLLLAPFFHTQEVAVTKADILKQDNVIRGDKLFQQNCAACHGPNATGGMGPNLTMSPLVRHDKGGADIGKVIHEGRMDKGMPAFPQLTDAQTSDIAAFLHARIDAFTRASALGASAFSATLNVGDPAAGRLCLRRSVRHATLPPAT